jgi:hypothetical protein
MLGLTGGDALALTEITTTAALILRQPVPDLAALILLALARDDLAERNSNLPVNLPAVWITLGQPAVPPPWSTASPTPTPPHPSPDPHAHRSPQHR